MHDRLMSDLPSSLLEHEPMRRPFSKLELSDDEWKLNEPRIDYLPFN
jgi:hypothetical protein